jgi:plastocyanin
MRMMPMAGSLPQWWMWVLFGLFSAMLIAGVALGISSFTRLGNRGGRGDRGRGILGERLARGDISPEEYSERLQVLSLGGSKRRRAAGPFALAFALIGLVGAFTVTATGIGTNSMMGDGMGMMGGGRAGRSGAEPSPGARTVHVIAREFSFQPREIRLSVAETVNIEFENKGQMFHTFTVGELGLDLRTNHGQSLSGALSAHRPGTYTFICAVPGHAQLGMGGSIVVTPEASAGD